MFSGRALGLLLLVDGMRGPLQKWKGLGNSSQGIVVLLRIGILEELQRAGDDAQERLAVPR